MPSATTMTTTPHVTVNDNRTVHIACVSPHGTIIGTACSIDRNLANGRPRRHHVVNADVTCKSCLRISAHAMEAAAGEPTAEAGDLVRFTEEGTEHIGYITRVVEGITARVCTKPGTYHSVALADIEVVR